MKGKLLSYKMQYALSFLPFIGFLIAWITSLINLVKKTRDKKYVFIHYLIWIIPLCIVGGLIALCTMTFMVDLSPMARTIVGVLLAYFACLMMAISCVGISQWMIGRYERKLIE